MHWHRLAQLLCLSDLHLKLRSTNDLELDWVHGDAFDDHDQELHDEAGDETDEALSAECHDKLRGLQGALKWQSDELLVQRLQEPRLHVNPNNLEKHHEDQRILREEARERELEYHEQHHK